MGKFKLSDACPGKVKRQKTMPKVSEITIGPAWHVPPRTVASKFGRGRDWLIGVDIETHDWETVRGVKGTFGEFGHYNLCAPIDLQSRIVQLGWAFGPAESTAIVKERLVRPDGFKVSAKATKTHRIPHERAENEGLELADVLAEFAADLLHVVNKKDGRLVCHHLEFDAGIISNEMARCGMTDASSQFASIAREALCTMDPQIGRWLREAWGEDSGNAEAMNTLSLAYLVKKLLPECRDLLANHHTAGVDALLHRKLAYALYGLCRAPCRLTADSHQKRTISMEGEGDVMECALCGERF